MYGDYRAVLPDEYAEFRIADSEQTLQAEYEKEVAELKQWAAFWDKPEEIEHFRKEWFEFKSRASPSTEWHSSPTASTANGSARTMSSFVSTT